MNRDDERLNPVKRITFNIYEQEEIEFEIYPPDVPISRLGGTSMFIKIGNGMTTYSLRAETSDWRQFAELLLEVINKYGKDRDFINE